MIWMRDGKGTFLAIMTPVSYFDFHSPLFHNEYHGQYFIGLFIRANKLFDASMT